MEQPHAGKLGRAKQLAVAVWRETKNDDVSGLAAELTYRSLLAIFPFFIFLAALSGVIADLLSIEDPARQVVDAIGETLPADAASLVNTQLEAVLGQRATGLLSVGLVTALWAASGGVKAVIKAMNRAYDVEETRSFIKRNLLALGLTIFTTVFLLGGFILAAAGGAIASGIADATGTQAWVRAAIDIGRLVGAVALLSVLASVLYWAGPCTKDMPFRWVTPGTVMFVVVWLLATLGFGFYVANFGSYNATYGALGGVIVLLLFFYISAYVLLAGAELNAVLQRAALAQQTTPAEVLKANDASANRGGEVPASPPPSQPSGIPGRSTPGLHAAIAALVLWRATKPDKQRQHEYAVGRIR